MWNTHDSLGKEEMYFFCNICNFVTIKAIYSKKNEYCLAFTITAAQTALQ